MREVEAVTVSSRLNASEALRETSVDVVQQLSRSRVYQHYRQAFERATKLPLELSATDAFQEVHQAHRKYVNPFCATLARSSRICDKCLKLQSKSTARNIAKTHTITCFAGLANSCVPVKVEDRVIAFLHTGQVFLRTPSAKRFEKIASQLREWGTKIKLSRLESAYLRSRVISPGLYRASLQLLEIFAEYLAVIANQIGLQQGRGDPPMIRRAKDYVAGHFADPIRLEKIAQTLHVNPSYFCRRFKQTTGLTFVKYLSQFRIEKAKFLLHNHNLRVSEIAYEVGFETLTHFNRTFRKLVGYSPTEYRSKLVEIR
jgi:AraC-like DNA-binding protein